MLSFFRKKMKIIMIVVAFVFSFSIFYGLGYSGFSKFSTTEKDKALLKVNGKRVDIITFNNIFSRLRQNFPERIKPSDILFLQNMALSQTIDFSIMLDDAQKKVRVSRDELNEALKQIAEQEKLKNISELKKAIESSHISWDRFKEMIKDDLLVKKINEKIYGSVEINPNDLREIKVSHILVKVKNEKDGDQKAKELIEKIKTAIQKGENFSVLAKKYSEDPGSKDKGGDLGFFSTGTMVKPFEDLAFSLKVSEIGGPVKTEYGYHIIKVVDARLKKIPGEKNIEAAVLKEKQNKAFQDWFYEIKKNAKVEILDPSLKALDLRFKGQIADAIAEYNKAIADNPNNAYYRLFLGLLYEDTKNLKQAISQYKEAIRLETADPTIYLVLGKAYLKNSQKDLAVSQFKRASLIAGDDKLMHKDLEKEFLDLGLKPLALAEKQEIVRIEKRELFEDSLRKNSGKVSDKIVTD